MSWEHELFALFDDLEGQASALWEVDRDAELADRARAEYATVTLASQTGFRCFTDGVAFQRYVTTEVLAETVDA